jgi:high-affinity iron transporter
MVDAVLLILREVLEAALILSLLLALCHKLHLQFRWSLVALVIGVIGSWVLAHYAYEIADAMEGTGQELLNAVLYLVVILSVITLGLLISPLAFNAQKKHEIGTSSPLTLGTHHKLIYRLFIVIVSFSLAREASEIWIYLSAFTNKADTLFPALIGSAIGAGIGMSLGACTYYAFAFMPKNYFIPIFLVIITLLAGGLSMQIAKQLMQIGLLNSGAPLWDSTFLVNEHSWVGELLYALVGYDSRPAPIQGFFYLLTVTPILLACVWHAWRLRVNAHE